MKAALLTVGTEILFGQVVNTNAAYLSEQLNRLGIDVMYHYTVGDNPARMKDKISLAFTDCDLLITTGGLGPTEDDLTKEMVCEVLGDELVLDDETMESLKEYERQRGRKITQNNYKQAWVPSKGIVFANTAGTAPGFALETDGKTAICLPGPPRELKNMFEGKVKPYLESVSGACIFYRQIRCFGLGESELETRLLPLIDGQTDPTLATYAKEGECAVRVASKRATREEAVQAVDNMTVKVKELVGDFIYSCDDEDMPQVVCTKLKEKGLTLSSAETCTGGLFAKTVTDIPGISCVFEKGYVVYSDRSKAEELGADMSIIQKYGIVSEESALELVKGLEKKAGSDICIASTGMAGPGGGSDACPVGLIYVALAYRGKYYTKKAMANHSKREVVRHSAVLHMLDLINKNI